MSDVLLGAIIGAGAVLAANLIGFVGSWRTSKKADANWRRDQRREAYGELIQAADDCRKAASDLQVTVRPVVDLVFGDHQRAKFESIALAFEEKSHLLDRAASRVNLLGSKEVQGHVNALALYALHTMSNAAQADPKASDEDWRLVTNKFFGLYDAFLNAAREDLGFDALPPPAEPGGPASQAGGR